ncbi:flagella synthesis protein FlgN [Thorsellia anophelis]|uniref:Flagella synthesis protein FlgN n=1 Tax=Thorsellia anophelis DSM 18579 TaxID=1123402 RepID=A0A1H9ZFT0_9GAMM|nr:flagellar export chaperone FlgN [Thorsellia anophelis]SES80455.1 flagella synthesis protein FlgN [Thorsellia anophelis DSM 18579]
MLASQLHKLLDDIYFYMKNLEPVLEKEQYILSQGKIDGSMLQGVTQQKEMMLASIISLNKRRIALQEEMGVSEPFNELNNYAISNLWEHISALSTKIAQQNMNNGFLLQYHINYASDALSVLEAEAGTPVYGPDGQSISKLTGGTKFEV